MQQGCTFRGTCVCCRLSFPTSSPDKHVIVAVTTYIVRQLCAGSHLHDNWIVVLRCLSRWAFVSQVASGSPTDLSLFTTIDPEQAHDLKKSWWMVGRRQAGKPTSPKAVMQPGTLLDAGMAMSADFLNKMPPPGMLEASLFCFLFCMLRATWPERPPEHAHCLSKSHEVCTARSCSTWLGEAHLSQYGPDGAVLPFEYWLGTCRQVLLHFLSYLAAPLKWF